MTPCRPLLTLLLLAVFFAPAARAAGAAEYAPNVAVAASAFDAIDALATAYQASGHVKPRLVTGATGRFYQQITAGAPFDLLFAADESYTHRLADKGLAVDRRTYAHGRLVLWAPKGGVQVSKGLAVLGLSSIKHVAIANPTLAPYGAAAIAALRHEGLYASVSHRLVQGESAAQAAQFVASGAAEAALLPLSLAVSPRLAQQGVYWLVPATFHPPIDAEAVIVSASGHQRAARAFLDYATGPLSAYVWHRFGFEPVTKASP
jgi:molybdate transport system substrate-binding protein